MPLAGERHQAAHGLGRRSRQKSRIPASKDFLPGGGGRGGEEEATIFLGEGARESPRARLLQSTRVFIVLITRVWGGLGAGGFPEVGLCGGGGWETTLGPGSLPCGSVEQVRAAGLCTIPPR